MITFQKLKNGLNVVIDSSLCEANTVSVFTVTQEIPFSLKSKSFLAIYY